MPEISASEILKDALPLERMDTKSMLELAIKMATAKVALGVNDLGTILSLAAAYKKEYFDLNKKSESYPAYDGFCYLPVLVIGGGFDLRWIKEKGYDKVFVPNGMAFAPGRKFDRKLSVLQLAFKVIKAEIDNEIKSVRTGAYVREKELYEFLLDLNGFLSKVGTKSGMHFSKDAMNALDEWDSLVEEFYRRITNPKDEERAFADAFLKKNPEFRDRNTFQKHVGRELDPFRSHYIYGRFGYNGLALA